MSEVRVVTAGAFAAKDFAPGSTQWAQFNTQALRNSVDPSTPIAGGTFTHIGIAADGNANGVRLAMRAVNPADPHTDEIRIPPGFIRWFDVRGLRNAVGEGLKLFSVALEDSTDSITIYTEID